MGLGFCHPADDGGFKMCPWGPMATVLVHAKVQGMSGVLRILVTGGEETECQAGLWSGYAIAIRACRNLMRSTRGIKWVSPQLTKRGEA